VSIRRGIFYHRTSRDLKLSLNRNVLLMGSSLPKNFFAVLFCEQCLVRLFAMLRVLFLPALHIENIKELSSAIIK
jgi:hypothetical protein